MHRHSQKDWVVNHAYQLVQLSKSSNTPARDSAAVVDLLCSQCRCKDALRLDARFPKHNADGSLELCRLIVSTKRALGTESCSICDLLVQTGQNADSPDYKTMYVYTAAKAFLGHEHHIWDPDDHIKDQGLTGFATMLLPTEALTRQTPVLGIEHSGSFTEQFAPRIVNSSSIDFAVVRKWLQICNGKCSIKRKKNILGFKVIHCPSRIVVEAPEKCPFVALSYVWGKGDTQTQSYPATIADSIVVCLALGFDYLWVDRYCIDQSNEDEKSYQVAQMDQIYSQASLTIIAAAGEHPDYGLPGVKDTCRQYQRCVQLKDCRIVEIYPSTRDKLCHSKWATRAWTYQEGFLSPRRLIFDDCQVSLVCGCAFFSESITHEIRHDQMNKYLNFTSSFFNAAVATPSLRRRVAVGQSVEHYTRKRLSSDKDSLKAALGILNSFQNDQISTHLWGVTFQNSPEKRMRLNWSHPKPARRRPDFPSWSWAGWEGDIFNRENGPLLDQHLDIKIKADDQQWIPIRRYLKEKHERVHGFVKEDDVPRLLQLTSRCATFRFFEGIPSALAKHAPGKEPHDDFYALLPLVNGIFRIHRILLDCEKTEIGRAEHCVILLTESIKREADDDLKLDKNDKRIKRTMHYRRPKPTDLGWSAIHLLLRPVENRYERIGLVTTKFPGIQNENHLLCDENGHEVGSANIDCISHELLGPLWVERAAIRTVVVG